MVNQTYGRWKSSLHQVITPRESIIDNGEDSAPLTSSSVIDRHSPTFSACLAQRLVLKLNGKQAQNTVGDWSETVTVDEWLAKRVSTEFPSKAY